MFDFFLIHFSSFFSFIVASHFLGGSFTYRTIPSTIGEKNQIAILVELRFHISNHYFICTPEDVNEHLIAYVVGEAIRYDRTKKEYLWHEAVALEKKPDFYQIQCVSESNNQACTNFQEETWGYCESANQVNGYSILRRQFLLFVKRFKPVQLRYSACCWADSVDKYFYFDLSIDTYSKRINSSPYAHIPASYYVDVTRPTEIQIFVYDADGDEIICKRFEEDLGKFLTVHVNSDCKLTYEYNRLGKQFGQFWLMDRNNNQILSRTLISIQVHVLENIVCHTQPEIIVKNRADHSKKSVIKIRQSVYISVSLNPNCLEIRPQDQTITELTTLCNNNQPVVLANGGIEVIFQCTPFLCEKYQVCFVGEFGQKLPSTKTECFSIEVNDTEDECAKAAGSYEYLKPRNRHFIISEPVDQNQDGRKSKSSKNSTAVLTAPSQSRRWLWILIILLLFFLLGFVAFFGFKQIMLILYPPASNDDELDSSNRDGSFTTTGSNMTRTTHPGIKQIDTSVAPSNQFETILDSPSTIKVRSQHVRLGPLDEYN